MTKTLLIYIASIFLICQGLYGQTELENQFLKDKVVGDTLDLSTFSIKPIELDTAEFFVYIYLTKKRGIIDSNFVTRSVAPKLLFNNEFKWNQLDTSQFVLVKSHSKDKDFTSKDKFSLPIQLDSNTIIIKHGWFYAPSYAGEQIDIWRLKEGEWDKVGGYLLWMS